MSQIEALLLVGGPYHDEPGAREALVEALTAAAPVRVTPTDDLSTLASPHLASHDVVIVYTTGGALTEAEARGLDAFVAGGKGLVGIHNAATSFKESRLFGALLGSRFVRHPPFGDVRLTPTDHDHPITRDLIPFTVPDELYVLEHAPDAFQTLATASQGDVTQPSVYVKSWGAGRVFYCGLGHDARCFAAPGFRALVGRGIQWAAGQLASAR